MHVVGYLHPRTLTHVASGIISSSSSAGGGGTSPMKVPISAKYIVQNNNYTVNSLNNLIKQVKERVRINFILIK
jgi:hypothetical protein